METGRSGSPSRPFLYRQRKIRLIRRTKRFFRSRRTRSKTRPPLARSLISRLDRLLPPRQNGTMFAGLDKYRDEVYFAMSSAKINRRFRPQHPKASHGRISEKLPPFKCCEQQRMKGTVLYEKHHRGIRIWEEEQAKLFTERAALNGQYHTLK